MHELLDFGLKYQLIFYCLFDRGVSLPAAEGELAKHTSHDGFTFYLDPDGFVWDYEVILVENYVPKGTPISPAVVDFLVAAMAIDQCLGVIGMAEGVFGEFEDLARRDSATSKYAFCTESDGPCLCLSPSLRASQGWQKMIDQWCAIMFPGRTPGESMRNHERSA